MTHRIMAALAVLGLCLVGTAQADSVTYTYDSLGRVITVVYVITGQPTKTITYAYDDAGNRITVSVTP